MDLLTYYTAHGLATVWSCNCKNGIVRQVDWLVRDISSLTLIKGCHLRLKLSKILYSGMYCLFLLIRNVIFQQQVNTMAFFIVVFALLSRHFESPIATRLYLKGYPASRAFFILMHFIKYMLIYIQPTQRAAQCCCVASWKALLYVSPPTSNIVAQQNVLSQVASTFFNVSIFFFAWQCLRWV